MLTQTGENPGIGPENKGSEGMELGEDYKRSRRGDPSEYTRRRKLIYEIEQALDIELEALENNRPRITNNDLVTVLKALIKDFGYKTEVVLLRDVHDREDLERISSNGGAEE